MRPTLYVARFENKREDSIKRVLLVAETPEEAEHYAKPIFRDKNYTGTWTFVNAEPIKAFIIPNGHGMSIPLEEESRNTAVATA